MDEIKNLFTLDQFLLSSSCKMYTGYIDNISYVFKRFDFDSEHEKKLDSLSNIINKSIIQPEILIKDNNNFNKGYLSKEFCGACDISILYAYSISQKIKILKVAKESIIEMHSLGIVHADLYLGNILFYKNNVKICDFDSCKYMDFSANDYNSYSSDYLLHNSISSSIDIYNFNLVTASILYNVNWSEILKFSYVFENKLNSEQKKIWQKVKTQEPLTSKHFLIDQY